MLSMGDSQASSNLDNSRTYQFVDNLSWIRGSHTLKVGMDLPPDARRRHDQQLAILEHGLHPRYHRKRRGRLHAGLPRTILTP